jgi:hypothetical protein
VLAKSELAQCGTYAVKRLFSQEKANSEIFANGTGTLILLYDGRGSKTLDKRRERI